MGIAIADVGREQILRQELIRREAGYEENTESIFVGIMTNKSGPGAERKETTGRAENHTTAAGT